MSANATVFVVDDDAAIRDALTEMLEAAGYKVAAFQDAEAFLEAHDPQHPGVILLDMQMPGMGGIELQAVLAARNDCRPIIFLTAHGSVQATRRVFKSGAFDFLEKPVEGEALLGCVRSALQRCAACFRDVQTRSEAEARLASLTRREREIIQLVAAGGSNKEIGRHLGISYRTVELHRMRIMRKTGAKTVIELAAITQSAGPSPNPPPGATKKQRKMR